MENPLNFNTLSESLEKSLEKILLKKFNLKLDIIFVENNIINLSVKNNTILISDAFHIVLCLLFNSYVLWKINDKKLSRGYLKKLQKNIFTTSSGNQITDLTLKQYSYIITDKFSEEELENLNLIKFEYVTESLVFFFLHEYAHIQYPYIKNEVEIDNLALKYFLTKYPNESLKYPYIFFKFMSHFDENLRQRAFNLSLYLDSLNELDKYFKDIK